MVPSLSYTVSNLVIPNNPLTSKDQISPLAATHFSYENLVLDQDVNFHVISLSNLITFFLDNVWILWGEVMC